MIPQHLSTKRQADITENGFTLIEAMLVIAILAIASVLAAPSLISQMQRAEIARTARDFENALEEAKRKAYISGRPHTVCPVDDVTITTPICAANWDKFDGNDDSENKGWIVFQDTNDNAIYDSDEKLLSKSTQQTKIVALSWTGSSPTMTLTPRQNSPDTGTMRIYAYQKGSLPTWRGSKTAVAKALYEMRVSLSGLGQIKFYQ